MGLIPADGRIGTGGLGTGATQGRKKGLIEILKNRSLTLDAKDKGNTGRIVDEIRRN